MTDLNDYRIILEVINKVEQRIEGNHLKPDIIIDKNTIITITSKVEKENKNLQGRSSQTIP